jgi:hypothetical protein
MYRLERFQAKSATLAKADLMAVFAGFVIFVERHPAIVRLQTLITPALPSDLKWVVRDGFRVANARPFYHHYPTVMDDSERAHAAELVKEFGDKVGSGLVRDIAIDLIPHDESYTLARFGEALEHTLGLDWPSSAVRRAFTNVCTLLRARRGSKVGRTDLYAALSDGNAPVVISRSLKLDFVRGRIESKAGHLGFDAEDGGQQTGTGAVPYSTNLQQALDETAAWARGQGYRRVGVDAPLRLSAAFGLGAAFRPASVFDLDYGTSTGRWSTDAHPIGSNADEWAITSPEGPAYGRLTVVVGVIRDPLEDVRQCVGQDADILHLHLPRAVFSGMDVQASVRTVKDAVSAAVTRLRPAGIDLFFLGPAAFAAALGHRWNALPPTTFFEHHRAEGYMPTVQLS